MNLPETKLFSVLFFDLSVLFAALFSLISIEPIFTMSFAIFFATFVTYAAFMATVFLYMPLMQLLVT